MESVSQSVIKVESCNMLNQKFPILTHINYSFHESNVVIASNLLSKKI